MGLTPADDALLTQVFNNLNPEDALQPNDPRYEYVYGRPECPDPIDRIFKSIRFSATESTTFFSGFRGSGKTTELHRLRKRLEQAGYIVLYADALKYLNPALPIDIADLLIVLAGSFSDALDQMDLGIAHESYWTRLVNWLRRTKVDLTEIGITGEAGAEGAKAGLDLKLALKTTPSFKQKLADSLAGRLGELRAEVVKFFEEGYSRIQTKGDRQVVFLLDSLEQIRGSLSEEKKVIRSVDSLFSNHIRMLSVPFVHMVYTVPPWLKFVQRGMNMAVIPCIRLWEKENHHSPCHQGISAMMSLISRRFPVDGLHRFFGENHESRTKRFIALSGGHFRDLFLLFRETILLADTLPVTDQVIENAVIEVRSHFLPIPVDDAKWLAQLAKEKASPLESSGDDEVSRLTRYLDSHIVLYLRNGEEWYDIHPLVRDEVARIVDANRA